MMAFLISSIILASLSACGGKSGQEENLQLQTNIAEDAEAGKNVSADRLSAEFTGMLSDFSIRFFQEALKTAENPEDNLMVSPYSLISALGLIENGTAGSTLAELEQVFGGISCEEMNRQMQIYASYLTTGSKKDAKFSTANSIWARKSEQIKLASDFRKVCNDFYDAKVEVTDFDDAAVSRVNKWVKQQTDGMIPSILDKFSEGDQILLLNAIAFDCKWQSPFRKESIQENEDFVNGQGGIEKAVMLNGGAPGYIMLNGAYGFTRVYEGGKFAFLGLLPEEGVRLTDYVAGLTGGDFAAALRDVRTDADVSIRIPEFKFDYFGELNANLHAVGISKMLDPNAADLGNMVETELSDGNLYISKVVQKTFIELNREGTKAAAVTGGMAVTKSESAPKPRLEIYLDRPFVFAILDVEHGIPIFIGVVNTLAE